jgi:hypothetical protein
MSTYQGHLADGSSVQAHSAGAAYPYVLQLRDRPDGAGYFYELIGPGIKTALRFCTAKDWDAAVARLKAVASIEDAWAFENEQLQTYANQKLAPMRYACQQMVKAGMKPSWKDMGKDARVGALLALGAMRNTLGFPSQINPPTFAALARRAV